MAQDRTLPFRMRTLEDIDGLIHGSYGLQATINAFRAHDTTNFYQSTRQWQDVLATCDTLIAKHKLTPGSPVIGLTDMPVVFAFRQAYIRVLQKMPEGIDECRQHLDDMLTTLQTVRSLNEVTPFAEDGDLDDFVVHRLKCGTIREKHIPTVTAAAKASVERWSARRTAAKKKPVQAWDERTYEGTILDRPDIDTGMLYPNGERKVMGHFILREDDGVRGKQLIDWAADEAVGVSDTLASMLVLRMSHETQKRIVNMVEQFH